jgi:hypothetical protein
MKKRQDGEVQEALAEARKAYDALGINRALLRLDSASIVRMIRDPEKLSALCDLLEEEARVHEAMGNAPVCEDLKLQAAGIRKAAAT